MIKNNKNTGNNKWILALIKLYDYPNAEYYQICGYNIPKKKDSTGSVWIDGGTNIVGYLDAEIKDRKWLENYKNKLHPNDEWTNVNLETYGLWIRVFNKDEGSELVSNALKEHVVGYLD